jgi:hypothetical protein
VKRLLSTPFILVGGVVAACGNLHRRARAGAAERALRERLRTGAATNREYEEL